MHTRTIKPMSVICQKLSIKLVLLINIILSLSCIAYGENNIHHNKQMSKELIQSLCHKSITDYLEKNMPCHGHGGKAFYAFEVLGSEEKNATQIAYIFASCQEFYMGPETKEIIFASGISGVFNVLNIEIENGACKPSNPNGQFWITYEDTKEWIANSNLPGIMKQPNYESSDEYYKIKKKIRKTITRAALAAARLGKIPMVTWPSKENLIVLTPEGDYISKYTNPEGKTIVKPLDW